MRDFWKIPGCLSVALVALGLSACGASSSKSADPVGTDAAASDAQVGDAAPNLDAVGADASLAALAADFCRQAAGAKCAWAFDCEGISAASRMVLGLAGDDVAECTENASAACVADTADRADRGTLVFDSVEMSDCIEGVGRAPCVPTPAVEWVADWRANVDSRCGRVLGGNVAGKARATSCCTESLSGRVGVSSVKLDRVRVAFSFSFSVVAAAAAPSVAGRSG